MGGGEWWWVVMDGGWWWWMVVGGGGWWWTVVGGGGWYSLCLTLKSLNLAPSRKLFREIQFLSHNCINTLLIAQDRKST